MNRDAQAHILMAIDALSPDVDSDEDALLMLDEVTHHLTQAQAILEDDVPQPKPRKRARKP